MDNHNAQKSTSPSLSKADTNAVHPSVSEQSFPTLSTPSHTSTLSRTTRSTDSKQPLHASSAPSHCLDATTSQTLTTNLTGKQDPQKVSHPKRKSLSLSKPTVKQFLTTISSPPLPSNPSQTLNTDSTILCQSKVELCKPRTKSTPTSTPINQPLSLPTPSRTALKNITNISSKIKSPNKIKPATLQCSFCNVVYSTRSGLYKHLTKNHPDEKENKGSIQCQECQCTFSCRVLSELRTHLQVDHQIPMEFEDKTFESQQGNYYKP